VVLSSSTADIINIHHWQIQRMAERGQLAVGKLIK
jgi:hypothetical protein